MSLVDSRSWAGTTTEPGAASHAAAFGEPTCRTTRLPGPAPAHSRGEGRLGARVRPGPCDRDPPAPRHTAATMPRAPDLVRASPAEPLATRKRASVARKPLQ